MDKTTRSMLRLAFSSVQHELIGQTPPTNMLGPGGQMCSSAFSDDVSFFFFFLSIFILYWLINNVLVSGVQQVSQLYSYLFLFQLSFHVGYYKVLSRVPCAI